MNEVKQEHVDKDAHVIRDLPVAVAVHQDRGEHPALQDAYEAAQVDRHG